MTDLNFPNAVSDDRDFYGRRDGLRQIETTLLTSRRVPVFVIGERRTGKTSLMNVALRHLQALQLDSGGARFVSLPVEPRGITTFSAFARSILQRLSAYLLKSWPDHHSDTDHKLPEIETIEQFEVAFTNLLEYGRQEIFLICVDEFDEIVRQAQGLDLARVFGLMNNLIEKTELPVSFFLTMTRIPESMKGEFPSSLLAMAVVIELRPFEQEEVFRLAADISANRLQWNAERLRDLFTICGGHPYFTKLILQHVLHRCEECSIPVEVSSAILNEAVYLALSDPRTDLVMENLYRVHFTDPEKEMFLLLARRQGALSTKELSAAGHNWVVVARRLVRRYYLVEDAGGIRFRFAFMHEWLRNWICFEEECAQLNTLQAKLEVPPEIEVNLSSGQVFVLGVPVKLSAQEFNIMDYLSMRAGELVHREDLIDKVWEASQGVSDQVVDTAFYRLRKRIGDQGQYIETIPGQGFRLSHVVRTPGPGRRSQADQKGESK